MDNVDLESAHREAEKIKRDISLGGWLTRGLRIQGVVSAYLEI